MKCDVLIRGGEVIDPSQNLRGVRDVAVDDGRIVRIAERITDFDAKATIDARGLLVVPGLIDLHVHVYPHSPWGLDPDPLCAANGVTTIRGMLGDPRHLVYRERAARGEIISPLIYTSGPSFNAKTAATVPMAVEAVIAQKKAGYDLLKVFEMPTESYEQMARTAHEVGIPFAGHVPEAVGLTGALDAGQASIDHLDRYVEFLAPGYQDMPDRDAGFFGSGVVDLADESRISEAVERTVAAGTYVVPTLTLVEHLASPESAEQMIRSIIITDSTG